MICTSCGFNNQTAAKFCGGCGSPLQVAIRTSPQAERRILSVIFCDMVGSTMLSERIDPEDLRELLQMYHAVCIEVVRSFDGFLADLMGDGAVIYFGYPTAHEDDEIRSVKCALALIDAVRALSSRVAHPFEVRIGAHRGRVVVGSLGGVSSLHSLAIGETPNLAACLQAEARPGEVVISDSLWRLISRTFQGVCLGTRRLKGMQRPVEIHRVISYQPASRYKGTADSFIGREYEREQVKAQWCRMLTGQCRGVIIRGEPGIGKSRFIQQIGSELADSSTTVMEAFCSPISVDTPYFPIAELLRVRLGLNGLETSKQLERLRTRLPELGLPTEEALPLFALFLSVQIESHDWPILKELSLARQRQRTLDLLTLGLKALATEAPVLLVVEDLHWADASTIEFLDQLFKSQIAGKLLILISARLEFQSTWNDLCHVTEIVLDALDPTEAESLIRHVASDKPMPLELVRQICERSSGNPLFLEEITLSVISSTSVVEHDEAWELVQPFSADVVPASMEAALMARLDQIRDAKSLIQVGATLGREFRLDLLSEVVSTEEAKLAEMMQQLVDEGFLRISGALPPTYIFKHALVQDVAYHSLLRSTRQEIHAKISEVIKRKFPDIARLRPELLAHHLSGAGQFDDAADQWQIAGQMAAARNAVNEAIEHINRGLLDLQRLPDGVERWKREFVLNTSLAPVQMAAYGWASPLVEITCQKAITLSERIGAREDRFAPLWGLWSNQFVAGRLDKALDSACDVLSLAESSGHIMHSVAARNAISHTYFYRGEYDLAIHHSEEGLNLFELNREIEMCFLFQSSMSMHIMTAYSLSRWMRGDRVGAHKGMENMLGLVRSLNHPQSLAAALNYQCYLYFYEHDWQNVLLYADEAVNLSGAEGYALWHACASLYKIAAQLQLGYPNATIAALKEAALIYRQKGLVTDPSTSTIVIRALQQSNLFDEALAESVKSLETAKHGHIMHMLPELHRSKGDVLIALGKYEEAQYAYQQALECSRDHDAVSLELRALHSMVSLRLEMGEMPEEGLIMDLKRVLSEIRYRPNDQDVASVNILLTELGTQRV